MRIAHLVLGMGVGGIETLLVCLANRQSQNHHVGVFVNNGIVDRTLLARLARIFVLLRYSVLHYRYLVRPV
jgi:hypothetical protein